MLSSEWERSSNCPPPRGGVPLLEASMGKARIVLTPPPQHGNAQQDGGRQDLHRQYAEDEAAREVQEGQPIDSQEEPLAQDMCSW
jgi:hypothetical protein